MAVTLLELLLFALLLQSGCCYVNLTTDTTKHTLTTKRRNNILKKWEFEADDGLEYPRGDKLKQHRISTLWSEYYACLSRAAAIVAAGGRLPAVYKASLEGSTVTLPCALCIAPGEQLVTWLQAQSSESPFEPISHKHHVVPANGRLRIHGARRDDSGVYKCALGRSGALVYLDVLDASGGYNVVRPSTSGGPYAAPPAHIQAWGRPLTVHTVWSPWSECSSCGRVGRRRRHGACYVKPANKEGNTVASDDQLANNTSLRGQDKDVLRLLKLFEAFPGGIPCRSQHLPRRLRQQTAVSQRRDEIMMGLCKVECESPSVFEVRSSKGEVLERANNTEGVFSLWQQLPTPAPRVVAATVFATREEPLNISCPGISFRDMPVSWRVGTKRLSPRALDRGSGGRAHLNARDQIVLVRVQYSDANLYSCWQRDLVLGTVRLVVWEGAALRCNQHVALAALLAAAALLLRAADRIVQGNQGGTL